MIRLLNEALATEIVCVLRYKRHYFMASGIHAQAVAAEFLEHANEEQAHADLIAARITQLGGEPNFNPDGLTDRSHSVYAEGSSLVTMIREDLVAERVAIDSYRQMIRFIGDRGLHHARHARRDPGYRGGARRGSGQPPRDARPDQGGVLDGHATAHRSRRRRPFRCRLAPLRGRRPLVSARREGEAGARGGHPPGQGSLATSTRGPSRRS